MKFFAAHGPGGCHHPIFVSRTYGTRGMWGSCEESTSKDAVVVENGGLKGTIDQIDFRFGAHSHANSSRIFHWVHYDHSGAKSTSVTCCDWWNLDAIAALRNTGMLIKIVQMRCWLLHATHPDTIPALLRQNNSPRTPDFFPNKTIIHQNPKTSSSYLWDSFTNAWGRAFVIRYARCSLI